jgi:hypothetical protein
VPQRLLAWFWPIITWLCWWVRCSMGAGNMMHTARCLLLLQAHSCCNWQTAAAAATALASTAWTHYTVDGGFLEGATGYGGLANDLSIHVAAAHSQDAMLAPGNKQHRQPGTSVSFTLPLRGTGPSRQLQLLHCPCASTTRCSHAYSRVQYPVPSAFPFHFTSVAQTSSLSLRHPMPSPAACSTYPVDLQAPGVPGARLGPGDRSSLHDPSHA